MAQTPESGTVYQRMQSIDSPQTVSYLHGTCGITPKRVVNGGFHRLGNTSPNKRRSGGEPLTTLCPI